MNNKDRAVEIYAKHIALASIDGRLFRKTVMDEIMEVCECSLAASATFYNNAKKAAPVEGLGRAPMPKGVRKPGSKGKAQDVQPDNECFSLIELVPSTNGDTVGRCQAFLIQGDASEAFDEKVIWTPAREWVMIQGLGPNHGDTFKLEAGEKEIKRYTPVSMRKEVVVDTATV
jgi:hypothetical protein